jgi:hypothetical protein
MKKISNAKAIVNFFRKMTTKPGISGELQIKSKTLVTRQVCGLIQRVSETYNLTSAMMSEMQNEIKNTLHSTPMSLKFMRFSRLKGCRVGVEW